MPNTLQIRIDDDLKNQATMVFDQLGLDLSTAVRMFLKKSVAINGIPFEVTNESNKEKALLAVEEFRKVSKENGNSELSLDEINKIINETRVQKAR